MEKNTHNNNDIKVQNINGFSYISSELIKSTAKMILITGTKSHCAYYDPFGEDTLIDCLECENNDLRITDDNGHVLVDFKAQDKVGKLILNRSQAEIKHAIKILNNTNKPEYKDLEYETYTLQFFENYSKENIIEYLKDNNSDYRLVRDINDQCMRLCKSEKNIIDEERRKFYGKVEEKTNSMMDIYSTYKEEEIIEKPETIQEKGKIKKLIKNLFK